jgi:archaeosine synthase alpha-subunit
MELKIKVKDGPGRIGKLIINEEQILTPNIIFINTDRFKSPDFSDLLISNVSLDTKKPVLEYKNKAIPKDFLKLDEKDYYFQDKKTGVTIVEYANQLFEKPRKFVDCIINLRKKVGPGSIIYTPGVATPSNLALLTYLSIDFFDSSSAIIAARNKTMFFPDAEYKIDDLSELACNCPICNSKEKISELTFEDILNHNYYILFNELRQVRNMIYSGNIRNYVEKKVQSKPLHTAILRNLDRINYSYLEENTPVVNNKIIYATSNESFNRPEIIRFQQRILNRYIKPVSAEVLLLLPCSAKKPYSFSKTHKFFRRKIFETSNPDIVHELIITSPLGLVPRELELIYPAANYDIPVTGIWSEDEKKMIKDLLKEYLSKNKYEKIIIHLPQELVDFIKEIYKKPVISCIDNPTSNESLTNLYNVLEETVSVFKKVDKKERQRQNIQSIACYQFGIKTGKKLLKNTKITGRYPTLKIMQENKQLGMLIGDKGFISLTLEGAEKISSLCDYKLDISDDFKPKGSILAPGIINAYSNIRVGDEVLIFRKNKLIGVGVACMNGSDMIDLSYGEAVKIRHITI